MLIKELPFTHDWNDNIEALAAPPASDKPTEELLRAAGGEAAPDLSWPNPSWVILGISPPRPSPSPS